MLCSMFLVTKTCGLLGNVRYVVYVHGHDDRFRWELAARQCTDSGSVADQRWTACPLRVTCACSGSLQPGLPHTGGVRGSHRTDTEKTITDS